MKINVTENKVSIKEEQILNENEYNIHKIQFDFSSEYTDDLVKVALFNIDNHTYKKIISNNECDIPPEVLTQRGYSILGVYAYKTEQDTLVLRYSPSPTRISVYDGSYKADAENSEPITPSEIEQYQQILQNSLQQFQNQYNALVEETEGDIQAIEDELQRKVDEGYFDGKDGYTPVRGVDYWTEEDKQEVEEEATQQIEGKIEEYNENAAEKLNQYNQNSVQKTNNYNTNAEQKTSAYNTNATEKFNDYNLNAEQKETNYNTNASQKVESFNTNASSKLSEYNSNAETKKTAYDENATQKTNSFNTNATNKLTEYNTNHTEKMSAYNSNSTEKLNAFNENAIQKTEDFDEHTEEIQDNIEILQRTDNQILSRFNKDEEVSGQDITLTGTTEIKFAKPPLPMGNSEQVSTTGANLLPTPNAETKTDGGVTVEYNGDGSYTITGTPSRDFTITFQVTEKNMPTNSYIHLRNTGTTTYNVAMILRKDSIDYGTFAFGANNRIVNKTTENQMGVNKIVFYGNRSSAGTALNITLQPSIELTGDTTSYEPYTGGQASPNPDYPQEITNVTGDVEVKVQNKNLLINADGVIDSTGNATYENGIIKTGGLNSYNWVKYMINQNPITLPAGNYTLAWKMKYVSGTPSYCSTIQFNNDLSGYIQTTLTRTSTTTNTTEYKQYYATVTLDTNLEVGNIFFQIAYGSSSAIYNIKDIMILKGTYTESTVPDYIAHQEQTFTFPLGNEKLMLGDYLADDGIHHVRGQVDLSTLTWSINSFPNQNNTLCLSGSYNQSKSKQGQNTLLCNRFKEQIQYNVDNEGIDCYTNGYGFTLRILKSRLSEQTAMGVKTWLQANLSIVEYELAEEVIVAYTSAQQRIYNEIKNAYSYDEITIITGSSDGNKPFFIVQTYKDLNKELNNKVDKVQGKELSSNDFTDTLKEKLEGLENYDDTEIKADISDIQDEQIEQNTEIEKLQEENARLKATLPTTTGEGQDITLDKTAELEFIKPPLPMGNSEQVQYSGKNLLNISQLDETVQGIRFKGNDNNELTISGTYTGSANYISFPYKAINLPAGTYTFTSDSNNTPSGITLRLWTTPTNLNLLNGGSGTTQEDLTSFTFSLIGISNGGTYNITYKIQLENGNTKTDFEPYVGGTASPNPDYPQAITNVTGDVEVVVNNKNLGTFMSGFISLQGDYRTSSDMCFYFRVTKGQSYRYQSTGNRSIGAIFDSVPTENQTECIDGTLFNPLPKQSAFVAPASGIMVIYTNLNFSQEVMDSFQVEKGTEATSVVPHKEQNIPLTLGNIELCKIGDYQDYFYKESNKWYLHKEISKRVFNGTEAWYSDGQENKKRKRLDNVLDGIGVVSSNIAKILSNLYRATSADNTYTGNTGIALSITGNTILIYDSNYNTAESTASFKQMLSNNNLILYYALATPTDTEITDTTLISQLEAINNALSYEEQTNISSNTIALFNVEAYQSTKLVLEEMATAIVALGGV